MCMQNSMPETIKFDISNELDLLMMTSNKDSQCYIKFDWLLENVEPIKFHVTFIFTRLTSFEGLLRSTLTLKSNWSVA